MKRMNIVQGTNFNCIVRFQFLDGIPFQVASMTLFSDQIPRYMKEYFHSSDAPESFSTQHVFIE